MERVHTSAWVVGRSMEPTLFEGDLVEAAPVCPEAAAVGSVYCFSLPWLQRDAAHRLVAREANLWRFRGDRQPLEEVVSPPRELKEIRRVLERRIAPDAGTVLFSLLRLMTSSQFSFPKNATAAWPWPEIILLGQRHRLNAALYWVLKSTGLWAEVPRFAQEAFEFSWREAVAVAVKVDATMDRLKENLPIEHRFLKGAVLRDRLYPAPELRVMVDIDVWVRDHRLAADHLSRHGFEWSSVSRFQAEFWPHTSVVDLHSGVHVDLHSTLFQAHRFRWNKFEGEAFSPEEEFVFLAAHLFQHFGRHGLTLLDLHLLLEQQRPDLLRARDIAHAKGALLSFELACHLLTYWFNDFLPDFSESAPLPLGQKIRLKLARRLAEGNLDENMFGRKKHFLQFCLTDRLTDFWKLWRDPARRKMH